MAMKHDLENLDAGQLDFTWSMMRLRKGGEQAQSSSASAPLSDVGTYINMAIVGALWLRVTGALDDLEKILPDKEG